MPITLDDHTGQGGTPVVKRTAIGETFIGAVVKTQQRDVLKDGSPALKDNGKPRQELVVHVITMPGTTSPAGISGTVAVPEPGEPVRLILRGASFGGWIEAKNALGALHVGDVVTQITDSGQVYDAQGRPEGRQLTTQAEIDAVPRSRTLGIYGPITLRRATPDEAKWVEAAEAAYMDADRITVPAVDVAGDEDPFVRDAGEWHVDAPGVWGAYPTSARGA